jgi:hypothetical protein
VRVRAYAAEQFLTEVGNCLNRQTAFKRRARVHTRGSVTLKHQQVAAVVGGALAQEMVESTSSIVAQAA